MEILIGILTIVLVVVSVIMILVVLMQRGSSDGGLGAAMGGGMAESALGAESSSVLSRWTRNIAIVFFVMVFGLYLGRLYVHEAALKDSAAEMPEFAAPAGEDAENDVMQRLIQGTTEPSEDAAGLPEAAEAVVPEAQDANNEAAAPEAPAKE